MSRSINVFITSSRFSLRASPQQCMHFHHDYINVFLLCLFFVCVASQHLMTKRCKRELTHRSEGKKTEDEMMMETFKKSLNSFFTDCFMNNYTRLCKFVCFYDAFTRSLASHTCYHHRRNVYMLKREKITISFRRSLFCLLLLVSFNWF